MFERKSMEQILDKMVSWTRGSTTRLTDFRVGSKIRTVYESVAVVVEEFYDKVYRSIKLLIEENIYTVLGFDKLPANYANGSVRFGRATPAETNLFIRSGTTLRTQASQYRAPIKYRTTQDAVLAVGQTFVDVPVTCLQPGVIGNVGAGEINDFEAKPNGIETVSNPSSFLNGREEESKEEQKARFQSFIQANSRGILQSVEYGASLAQLQDSEGVVLERVVQAVAIEDLENKRGEVDVYLWNGVGEASEALIERARTIVYGTTYKEGVTPVYGYKPGGIIVNYYSAIRRHVTIKLEITSDGLTSEDELHRRAEEEIDRYFATLKMGTGVVQTALEANIKYIDGVADVKVYLSTDDGVTYHMNNIPGDSTQIILPRKPINRG